MVHYLQELPLPVMFLVTLVLAFALCWAVFGIVRLLLPRLGHYPGEPVPIKDAMIGASAGMFALMLAFCAAGIWNDTTQARAAVQREINALENMLALARSLPGELQQHVTRAVHTYANGVVEIEWPTMAHQVHIDHPTYDTNDRILIELVDRLAREQARPNAPPTVASLMTQLFELRSARINRLALSNAGVTNAQWWTLVMLAAVVMTAIALVHNHHLRMQMLSMNLYAAVAATAFFVIMAHDRPFAGAIAVSPAPFQQLAKTASVSVTEAGR